MPGPHSCDRPRQPHGIIAILYLLRSWLFLLVSPSLFNITKLRGIAFNGQSSGAKNVLCGFESPERLLFADTALLSTL